MPRSGGPAGDCGEKCGHSGAQAGAGWLAVSGAGDLVEEQAVDEGREVGCALAGFTDTGGGIAGLASALALTRGGWRVEIFERDPEFTEAGAGLSLWPNALRALDAPGVGEAVRGRSVLQGQVGSRDAAGRWLSRTDTAELERRYGLTAIIHRADLPAVLRAAVPGGVVHPGTTVNAVRPETVMHTRGECVADLVVGADGLHSITRRPVWPGRPAAR